MEAIDVIKNLSSVWLIVIASLSYCYFISAKLSKGIYRLISLIPTLIIFNILPFHLCSAYAIVATSICVTWLCSFKLILFAFDQGPLSWQNSKLSLPIFISMSALPIKIKENKYPPIKMKLPSNLAIQLLLFSLVAEVLIHYRGMLSAELSTTLIGTFIFLLVNILFCFCFLIGKTITGLELEYPSKEPFLSTSVQEFWGRRWSIPVSDTLRHTIYIPVRTASENVLGKGLVPTTCLGVMAAFLVSGVMHELLYYHITLGATSWEVTLLFLINGAAVSIEIVFKDKFKGKLRLPWFVSAPLTVGFVLATSGSLQFPQMIRNGADVRLFDEFAVCVEILKTKILDFSSLS